MNRKSHIPEHLSSHRFSVGRVANLWLSMFYFVLFLVIIVLSVLLELWYIITPLVSSKTLL